MSAHVQLSAAGKYLWLEMLMSASTFPPSWYSILLLWLLQKYLARGERSNTDVSVGPQFLGWEESVRII